MCCTLNVRLSSEARAFLRTVRNAGGSLHVEQDWQIPLAKECAAHALLGFAGGTIGAVPRSSRVEMTGRGYDYLDRLMRAH
ncbi:hypothetical protein [Ensifer sp. ZNC0028]|uniref:hypothetical protein n=1 Tax=Ensifer sp. ZNC0028 TaxID=1339236 RepID=UPI0005BC4671|nr:hypothetical protein [Ensifer sp. ZNC0028]